MARKIDSRLKISGTLAAESPIHVGGINTNPEVDLALAVNGQGQYYIPGTSLAGALRGWMQILAHNYHDVVNNLWGFQEENGRGHASFVVIEDAPIQGAVVEVRDGVGIDRFWGSAAERVKYDRAILPKGVKIPLNITLEVQSQSAAAEQYKWLFANLLQILQNGEICLGAAKTRGLGRVKLENLSIKEQVFSSSKGMLNTLRHQGKTVDLKSLLQNGSLQKPSKIIVKINWEPTSPLMVKASGNGIAVDILPLVSGVDDYITFVLPGSSIKGTLRVQAEKIVRTVRCLQTPNELSPNLRFIQQLEVPLVEDLFGARTKTEHPTQKGLGVLSVDDCYAEIRMSREAWGSVESAQEGVNPNTNKTHLQEALNAADLQDTQQAFHVAVDRWTGGAADGFLYSTLELKKVSWQPICLILDLNRLKEHKEAGVSLVLLVLRDLAAGRIPLGYGTNRGMGSIKVKSVEIQGQNLPSNLLKMAQISLPDGNFASLDRQLLNNLNSAWKEWIN